MKLGTPTEADGETLFTAEIQRYMLGQVGVGEIEAADPELSQQYRSALEGRRFALVLENALGVEDVRRLAQPWPESLVLVTTHRLTDEMRAWPAPRQVVELHGLDTEGAWALLASRCGGRRSPPSRGRPGGCWRRTTGCRTTRCCSAPG